MKNLRKYILVSGICTFFFLISTLDLKSQAPINDLLVKYEENRNLKTFNQSKDELEVSKLVSINLAEKERSLILATDEQYTLLYTGGNPTLNSFYDEAINILKSKKYILTSKSDIGELKKSVYMMLIEKKITELVTVTKNSNGVSILVSKGNFDKGEYKPLNEANRLD